MPLLCQVWLNLFDKGKTLQTIFGLSPAVMHWCICSLWMLDQRLENTTWFIKIKKLSLWSNGLFYFKIVNFEALQIRVCKKSIIVQLYFAHKPLLNKSSFVSFGGLLFFLFFSWYSAATKCFAKRDAGINVWYLNIWVFFFFFKCTWWNLFCMYSIFSYLIVYPTQLCALLKCNVHLGLSILSALFAGF